MRVGGTEPIKVDVRVICATNRNLAEAVRDGRFRADLYYRLNVIQIDLPPLRERVGDIEDLVNHYVKLLGGPQRSVSDEAMLRLSRYSWPGNVRELRNVIERMVVLSENDVLDVGDLPKEITESSESPSVSVRTGGVSLKDAEKDAILAALAECRGNKKLAASKLKISRSTLYEKIKEYGLENV
jgi:two-component system response regulator HydG